MSFDTGINVKVSALSTNFGRRLREGLRDNRELSTNPAQGALDRLADHIQTGGRLKRSLRVTNTTKRTELAFEFKHFGYKQYRVDRTAEMLKAYLEADGLPADRAAALVDGVLFDATRNRYRVAKGRDIVTIRDRAAQEADARSDPLIESNVPLIRTEPQRLNPPANGPVLSTWPPERSDIDSLLKARGFDPGTKLGAGSFGEVVKLKGPNDEALVLKYLVKGQGQGIAPQALRFDPIRSDGANEAMASYLSRSGSQPQWQQTSAMVAPSHYVVASGPAHARRLEMIAAADLKARARAAPGGSLECVAQLAPAVKGNDLFDELQGGADKRNRDLIRQKMPLLAHSFLTTLRDLNERGIVHRDIKVENIMREGDQLKLIDWGMMYKVRKLQPGEAPSVASLPRMFLGTPTFIHPKITQGVGTQIDLHAWGITMLLMLEPELLWDLASRRGEQLPSQSVSFSQLHHDLIIISRSPKSSNDLRAQADRILAEFSKPDSPYNLARLCLEAADITQPGFSALQWMDRAYSRAHYERLLAHPSLQAAVAQQPSGVQA
ncbi:MAG: hypothetical protein RL322_2852 [Pseudomonadota bacterium]|jgi:hypothetical protein